MVFAVDDPVAAIIGEKIRPGFEPVVIDRVCVVNDKVGDQLPRIAGYAD
jgi:hypothetical protein